MVHQPDKVQFLTTEGVDLFCLSDINLAVDTPISVNMTWSGSSGNRMLSDGRISVLGDRGTFTEPDSTLQFSSLRSSDTGTYTCTSVASSTSPCVVANNTTSAASSINASMCKHHISIIMPYTYASTIKIKYFSSQDSHHYFLHSSGSVSQLFPTVLSCCFLSDPTLFGTGNIWYCELQMVINLQLLLCI